jgi:multidrug efflux pump subunit AcrA (membrane-fusion protein)
MSTAVAIPQVEFKSPVNTFQGSRASDLTTPEIPVFRKTSDAERYESAKPLKKRSSKTWVWLAVVAVVGVSGSARPWTAFSSKSVAASPELGTFRTVTVDRPARAETASVVLPATIRPWQTTTLFARASGYLAAWHKDLGARVNAGDLLAEIDTPELDQEVASAEALAHEAIAAVAQARAERDEARADLKVAESQLVRVRADNELARNQMGRREKLLKSRAVSEEEYDNSAKLTEARTADVAAAESDIVRRRTNLETRAAIIDVREATAKSRQATVDRLKELQNFKKIVAPFDGVVIRRTAEVGMLVTGGQDALFVLEDMSRVRVQINVPQTYAVETSPGVAATISLPESTRPAVAATITRVSDSVDSTNRTMLAEIELENSAHRFQPGSYVQVGLTTPQSGSAWTIPANAVAMRVAGPRVAVVNEHNKIEIRPVTLGRDLGARVVVVDGIQGDERLVLNPGDDLSTGVRVQVRDQESGHELAASSGTK